MSNDELRAALTRWAFDSKNVVLQDQYLAVIEFITWLEEQEKASE